MKEYYSSLYKGNVHVTTPYSDSHKALDMGNYKAKNKIYSPTRFGTGTVTKYTKSYTYKGVLYKDAATIWYTYTGGWVMCLVHGDVKDQIVKVGDKVKVDFTPDGANQPYFYGEVLYIPQDTGDMWHFKVDDDIIYVNPSCARLETIIRMKP